MDQGFLGRGVSSPLRVDAQRGGLQMASDEEKIRQSIWLILTTAPGERVMRADFGCGIHDLVFESMSDSMFGRVGDAVRSLCSLGAAHRTAASQRHTRRKASQSLLLISIDYAISASNGRQNLRLSPSM